MPKRHVFAVLLAAAFAAAGCKDTGRSAPANALGAPTAPTPVVSTPGPIEVPPALKGAVSFQEGFAPIVERLSAAVVNISAVKVVQQGSARRPAFFSNPLFRDFFGEQHPNFSIPRERREQSMGSGVIVSEDGYILTNNHVVADASRVRIFLPDRREFQAKIVGTDPKTDIAVLKVDGQRFAYAPFGDSSKVRVGEFALAIGNPFGLGQTVTLGIISAVGRGNIGIVDYEDFIQTDAAINPGNSGGALVNATGELIGINTAILARGAQGNQGVGFAVPSELARAVMDQIIREGRVVRGYMGVGLQDVTPGVAEALGMKEPRGVLVAEVAKGSPADEAGLERGDILVEIDGKPVADSRAFRMRVAQTKPGSRMKVTVLRADARREVTVDLTELPGEEGPKAATGGDALSERLGITIAPLAGDLRRRLSLPDDARGVAVVQVEPDGRAQAAGLRPGDVIQEVNRSPISSPEELMQALDKARGRALLLLVLREGRTRYVIVESD
jgi:serine protease Do